jgi:glyoxylase-like metal-dependent hydrolase (beta-lactamase superfamily II)
MSRPGEAGWQVLGHGDVVIAGDVPLAVLHTPGHAEDHICFWDERRRYLYSGDMVITGTTVMVPGGKGGNMRQYLASLEALAVLRPVRIYPGHGPVIDDPVTVIGEYLAHRRQREREILSLLADGVTAPEAIVKRLYQNLPEDRWPAAVMTVQAHLEKIREDAQAAKHA